MTLAALSTLDIVGRTSRRSSCLRVSRRQSHRCNIDFQHTITTLLQSSAMGATVQAPRAYGDLPQELLADTTQQVRVINESFNTEQRSQTRGAPPPYNMVVSAGWQPMT